MESTNLCGNRLGICLVVSGPVCVVLSYRAYWGEIASAASSVLVASGMGLTVTSCFSV